MNRQRVGAVKERTYDQTQCRQRPHLLRVLHLLLLLLLVALPLLLGGLRCLCSSPVNMAVSCYE